MPRRRRWWLLAIAVALAAVAAVGNVALIAGQDARVDVLVLTRDVGWGQPVGDADLGVAQAVAQPSVALIPAAERARVLGQFVRSALPAGTLLADRDLTAQTVPGPGEWLVGLPVKPGHLPARGLIPGDLVQVSSVPADAAADPGEAPTTGAPFRARVVGVGPADSSGAVTLDVVVSADVAPAATTAAAGQVVVVELGPGA